MTTRSLASTRVAVYARYSSDRQRDASIEDQVRRCREHIDRLGGVFDPELVFTDHAVSGASLQRPAFEALMARVRDRHRSVDVIVTEDLSRVSRDFADAARVFKELEYLRVPLLGVADGIDTSARGAKLNYTLKSLIADVYLDDLRDKTLRGLEGRALAGFSTGGLPLGYRSEPSPGRTARRSGAASCSTTSAPRSCGGSSATTPTAARSSPSPPRSTPRACRRRARRRGIDARGGSRRPSAICSTTRPTWGDGPSSAARGCACRAAARGGRGRATRPR